MKYRIIFFTLLICSISHGQSQIKRALFIGNSYTATNNLPQIIANMALSTGDTLLFDSNVPGGYRLKEHSTNATSLTKIGAGNWDYVVLQEQSQYPSFSDQQVQVHVFPYAHILDSIIKAKNPCAETVFYMTWGRKNGDASNCSTFSWVCTYPGMDSMLNLRYRMMANSNNAIISPVGAVWKYIRQSFPQIELYQADESHPSVAGTYAAACCFYAALFRKDPALITFNSSLSDTYAAQIRAATKLIVYDSLANWHIGEYDPSANFSYHSSAVNQITFINSSANATNFYWNFGDGDTSSTDNPAHLYLATGSHIITLVANKCGISDTTTQTINITSAGVNEVTNTSNFIVYPNPSTTTLTISKNMSGNLSYRIFNLKGQEIQTGRIIQSEKQIPISALPNGVYFMQLFDSNKLLGQQKFIKSSQ